MIPDRPPRRRLRSTLTLAGVAALTLGLVMAPTVQAGAASAATTATKPLVVSLTFDDSDADQLAAANTLVANGMRGTFFINSGFLGAPGYMTSAQVQALAAAGHEIGGHTVNHPDLVTISAAEAKRQICLDRANLTALGLTVTDFAYPFASENASVETIAAQCGYNSGRGLGDLKSPYDCSSCVTSETIPPAKPMVTRALDEVESNWTLANLQSGVTNAQARGGWVQYTFHHICTTTSCPDPWMSSTLFTRFIQWLGQKAHAAGSTISVKTVAQVIAKPSKPVVQPSYPAPAGPGVNAISNPSLETFDTALHNPTCFQQGGYGTNMPAFSVTSAAHTGTAAERLVMSGYSDGDAKLLPTLDLGQCAPSVVPQHTYSLREWYTSTAVTQFAVYLRDTAGRWTYWTSSPWFAASSGWKNASWTTPAIPANATGLSFGLNLFANGTLVTDDFSMYDSVGAPAVSSAVGSSSALVPNPARSAVPGAQRKGTLQVPSTATTGETIP